VQAFLAIVGRLTHSFCSHVITLVKVTVMDSESLAWRRRRRWRR